jgi:hypothetical protein
MEVLTDINIYRFGAYKVFSIVDQLINLSGSLNHVVYNIAVGIDGLFSIWS